MNEVSKCAAINCPSFDNLHFPLNDVNIKILVLKATVRKLLLSTIVVQMYCLKSLKLPFPYKNLKRRLWCVYSFWPSYQQVYNLQTGNLEGAIDTWIGHVEVLQAFMKMKGCEPPTWLVVARSEIWCERLYIKLVENAQTSQTWPS